MWEGRMPQDLSVLNSNLPTLYHFSSDSKDTLVANLAGTHIYSTSRGWGRFWRILYAIIELFVSDSLRLQKLKQALNKTHDAFQEQLKFVTEYVNKFQTYLEERIEGYSPTNRTIPEEDYYEIGHVISNWNNTTLLFIRLLRRNQHDAINAVFRQCMEDQSCDVAKLFKTDITKKCIHFQRILNLEYELDLKIPLEALARLSNGKSISTEQKKEVRTFVKKINSCAEKVGIRLFHRAMRYFLAYVSDRPKYEKHVTRMENDLTTEEYGGCSLIIQPDSDHLEWREGLKPGDSITADLMQRGKVTLELGEQIGKKDDGTDKNVFFAVKGHPDKILWSSVNEAILSHKHWGRSVYKQKFSNNPNDTLWPVDFLDIDKTGRFALMERLHTPLDKTAWRSTSPDIVDWNDIQQCTNVIEMIKNFINLNYTPYPLAPKYLMLDPNKRVRSTKILYTDSKNPFNHCALEDFVIAYANNNLAVFRHVMTKSGLLDHKYSTYYKAVVKNTIEGKAMDPTQLSQYKSITDHRIVDRGQELHKAVLVTRAEIYTRLLTEFHLKKDPVTEKLVGDYLYEGYKCLGCASVLWPTLSDIVYGNVCKHLKLQPKLK